MWSPDTKRTGSARARLLVVGLVAAVLLTLALAACGGTNVTGTYKWGSGTVKGMEKFTMTLKDDKTLTISGPNPMGGKDISVDGTYKVSGDQITVQGKDAKGAETGKIDGNKLVFKDVTWVKQ